MLRNKPLDKYFLIYIGFTREMKCVAENWFYISGYIIYIHISIFLGIWLVPLPIKYSTIFLSLQKNIFNGYYIVKVIGINWISYLRPIFRGVGPVLPLYLYLLSKWILTYRLSLFHLHMLYFVSVPLITLLSIHTVEHIASTFLISMGRKYTPRR